jgi:large subunit ribosomal protein L23
MIMAAKKPKPKTEEIKVPAEKPNKKETDPWSILKHPHLAEKSMKMVEAENKLVFMVKRNARKIQIKEAIEKAFDVKVTKVNFEITMNGEKKAYVKLSPEFSASDIATRMGMV